jgi:hypothetical protein
MKIYEDGIEREATEADIEIIEAYRAEGAKQQKAEAKALAAKNAAKQAVYDKLGLTADEVAALLA